MDIRMDQIRRDAVLAQLLAERCAMIEAMHAEILALRDEIQTLKTIPARTDTLD